MSPRVRFAPSPSGYLHIGGARTALFNWLWARSQGGQFILRIEDTDQDRASIESVRAILDSMRWLGLDWDEGPEVGGDRGPYFQSERKDLYRAAVERLIERGHAYRCYCTKEELDRARAELKAKDPKAQFVYPGTCRNRKDSPDLPHVVRFKSPDSGVTRFVDKVFGEVSTPNEVQQDFVIVRTDGFPLYNLAAVVDDHIEELARLEVSNSGHTIANVATRFIPRIASDPARNAAWWMFSIITMRMKAGLLRWWSKVNPTSRASASSGGSPARSSWSSPARTLA